MISPEKLYKALPEAYKDLPAAQMIDILKNPGAYDISTYDYIRIAHVFTVIWKEISNSVISSNEKRCEKIEKDLSQIGTEVGHLKLQIGNIRSELGSVWYNT